MQETEPITAPAAGAGGMPGSAARERRRAPGSAAVQSGFMSTGDSRTLFSAWFPGVPLLRATSPRRKVASLVKSRSRTAALPGRRGRFGLRRLVAALGWGDLSPGECVDRGGVSSWSAKLHFAPAIEYPYHIGVLGLMGRSASRASAVT